MIAVVVINWNGWRDTLAAYRSLSASEYADWHLIVVDNASTDGSAEQLAQLGRGTTLIVNPVNAGFAGGCNVGIRAAMALGCDHVFLLNNDAAVGPETLGRLANASAALGDAVLGCVVRYQGSGGLQYFGSRTATGSGMPEWFRTPRDLAQLERSLIATDFVFGAALFAPARLFDQVGLFDERFFLTFEETDWCYRARAAGISCMVVRDAIVEHVGSASMGSLLMPLQAYFLQRNRLLFCEKHAGRGKLLRALCADLVACCRRLARETFEQSRGRPAEPRAQALIMAIRDYLGRRFGDCPEQVRALQRRAAQSLMRSV